MARNMENSKIIEIGTWDIGTLLHSQAMNDTAKEVLRCDIIAAQEVR